MRIPEEIYTICFINVFVILPFFLVNFVQIILPDKAWRTILCLKVLHVSGRVDYADTCTGFYCCNCVHEHIRKRLKSKELLIFIYLSQLHRNI